jgi:hypothetical protein
MSRLTTPVQSLHRLDASPILRRPCLLPPPKISSPCYSDLSSVAQVRERDSPNLGNHNRAARIGD